MRAVASDDSEHGARRAVTWIAGDAERARPAARVDLADHARADLRAVVARFDHADELVSERPAEPGVPSADLDVRVADAAEHDADDRLAARFGFGNIGDAHAVVRADEGSHGVDATIVRA